MGKVTSVGSSSSKRCVRLDRLRTKQFDKEKCKYCKRTREHPNPLKKGRSSGALTLQFYGTRSLCNPCRGFLTSSNATSEYRDQVAEAEEGSTTHTEYCVFLDRHIEKINNSENGYIRSSDIDGPITEVKAKEQSAFRGTLFCGYFWNATLYEFHMKEPVPGKKSSYTKACLESSWITKWWVLSGQRSDRGGGRQAHRETAEDPETRQRQQ